MKASKHLKRREILQNASDALDVARNLAPVIPVPVLCSIFITAKGILDIAIKMRQDKRDSAELAEYAATLTSIVHKTIRGNENLIDKDLSLSLNQLSNALDDIKVFMERQVALRFWERLCTRSEVSERLIEYRTRLEYVMQTFLTTSSLRQEMSLKYLKDGMDDLKDTLQNKQNFDDQFRIYRWGEVEIIRPHDLPSDSVLPGIEIYDAKIDGHLKVIKVYRDQDVFAHSRSILKLVRDQPGLPFTQLEGYASATTSPFVVLKGGLTNMFDYLEGLSLIDYFTERLRFMIDMKRAMRFLGSNGFRWKGWVEKLMISESGRLAIGYVDDIVQRSDKDSDGGTSHIIISWPKVGIAEGLHVLVDRQDDILSPLYSSLDLPEKRQTHDSLGVIWGRYIDELSCGISSFVTVINSHPPPLGSVGLLRPSENGVHFDVLFSSYKGKVNVRTTGQIRPRTGREELDDAGDDFDVRNWRNFEGEEISMPLLLTEETGLLLSYRTTYAQLHGHARVIEHLVQNIPSPTLSGGMDLESYVVVSAIVERARVTFSKGSTSLQAGLASTHDNSIFFHPHLPDERGFRRKPWGFLSHTTETALDSSMNDDILASQVIPEQLNTFHISLGGVSARTEQSYELHCFQFSSAEAEAVRYMHGIY